jgi:methionyl-tRNA synthetase
MNNIITCALPYANGNLHIGHFFEATCADIKSRHLTHTNSPHFFVSGDDCHGAATTIFCTQNKLDIDSHIENQFLSHKSAYDILKINFHLFSKTNSTLHKKVVNWCIENIQKYQKDNNISLFETRNVLSWFDLTSKQFLPDRYVKGQCPHCNALEQHPEICEKCNKNILAHTLINPISVITKELVHLKNSKHLILSTSSFYSELEKNEHLFHSSIKV